MISASVFKPRLDAVISRALEQQRLVGAVVLVSQNGDTVYERAAGFADREAQQVLRADDIFRIASLSKPLVTATAMALIERGRLRLEDAAAKHAPLFRPKRADGSEPLITVRQLLTHTAGLSYGFLQPPDGPYARLGVGDGLSDRGVSMAEQLTRLSRVPLSYDPGTAWVYSLAIDVLGAVIEGAAGQSLPEAVRELVTGPLQLEDTGFTVQDPSRLVVPYADARPPRRMREPDTIVFGPATIHFSPGRVLDAAAYPSGGGGMAGSAPEYLKFLEALRCGGGPVLQAATVRSMMSNQIGDLRVNMEATAAFGFGFGGAVLLDPALAGVPCSAGTYQWGGVYGHHWYIDPARKLTVVCLTNTTVEGMAGKFVEELRTAVYGQ